MNGRERIVSALNLHEVDRTPVWFMRQAGRHLPEYRKIASETSFWERCMDVDLCTKITCQPLERYPEIDAAIVFSDILTPLPSLGYEVKYGGGIKIDKFQFEDIDSWPKFNSRKDAPWAANALNALSDYTEDRVAHLGFVGSPWTIGMYLLAGGTGDKEFIETRGKINSNPDQAKEMFDKLGTIVGNLLADQVNYGGANAVQIFDTWAGLLDVDSYREYAMPGAKKALEVFRSEVNSKVPVIHYAKGSGHLHQAMMELDVQCFSLDWRDDMQEYREKFGNKYAFQGNLDPSLLTSSVEKVSQETKNVLMRAGNSPGHIFNLGHGFSPSAKIDCVESILRTIKDE